RRPSVSSPSSFSRSRDVVRGRGDYPRAGKDRRGRMWHRRWQPSLKSANRIDEGLLVPLGCPSRWTPHNPTVSIKSRVAPPKTGAVFDGSRRNSLSAGNEIADLNNASSITSRWGHHHGRIDSRLKAGVAVALDLSEPSCRAID